ncbi:MAG: transglycosylase SLT domain-containing protein [Gammaproteobacteria bacterium]|nr:transglycosylase SLT domain-containing protein [Gammaproteobacteria bacterium]
MSKKYILLSVSALLLISSIVLSQTTSNNSSAADNFSNNQHSTPHRFDVAIKQSKTNEAVSLTKLTSETHHDAYTQTHNHRPDPLEDLETSIDTTATKIPFYSDEKLAQLRQLFLHAENAIKTKNDTQYFLLIDQLKEYSLYPYIQYQWLKKHLSHKQKIKHFLQSNPHSRYAKKLKRQWLYYLAKRKQWPIFLEFYYTTNETTLNCYYHRAQFYTGNKQAALIGAKKLWVVGKSQPRQCDPLFVQLQKSNLFTQDLRWQRFEAALHNNKVGLAKYIKNLMPGKHHATAQLWINLHRDPARYMRVFLKRNDKAQSAMMFSHAINRLASKDITRAIQIWDTNKKRFTINKNQARKLEKRLALKLVFKRESGAYDRLSQLEEPDSSSRTWRIRTALLEQNWPNVLTAIHALSDTEKAQEKWQYWLARAYMETDEIAMAQALLTDLSNKRSFYGFLAADKVNSLYKLSNNPIIVSPEEITNLKHRKEFHVAFELMVLDKKNEAKLQWWHALKQLNKNEIIIAAKLAQQWQWDEIAIFTIAKAKHWDDIAMRFPQSYADKVHKNSAKQKLNPAIVFGLIRRESAFNEKAHSPVGARGLMQIMPRTGRQIARHFNERWRGANSLYNPATNVKYGSYYYQKLLNQFDGHYALALAAYNAGPERVKKWLPETKPLPADIWIETIPFHETREYVATVLAYTLIYQQQAQSTELSMNDFTRDVLPITIKP